MNSPHELYGIMSCIYAIHSLALYLTSHQPMRQRRTVSSMSDLIFDQMATYDYENLFFCQEKTLGLRAIIAIHDTTLGPAAGGIRMWPYASEGEAVRDVLRLARGMTYKCAAAGAAYGGGKCVVFGDPKRDKTEARLRALARFINRLNGLFITGIDVGTNLDDMVIMREESPYIVTLPESRGLGDSSRATAYGVVQGMRACLNDCLRQPRPVGPHCDGAGRRRGRQPCRAIPGRGGRDGDGCRHRRGAGDDGGGAVSYPHGFTAGDRSAWMSISILPARWALSLMKLPFPNYAARLYAARPITSLERRVTAICCKSAASSTPPTTS